MSYKAGDLVRWSMPLDNDYSYGYIINIKRSLAEVICTGYYSGQITEVHLKFVQKYRRGGVTVGGSKGKDSKRSATIPKVQRREKY